MVMSHRRLSIAIDSELVAAIDKAVAEGDRKHALALLRAVSKLVKVARTSKCGIPNEERG